MPDTVYVLGAGLNQSIKDWNSLSPPMRRNFFQVVLKNPRFTHEFRLKNLEPLFSYIEKYWKLTRADLSSSDFDLEECFTLLETQRQDAVRSNDEENSRSLYSIEFSLKGLLAELLSDFETFSFTSESMRAFGKMIYDQKPLVINFNYDTMTEAAIESGSGLRGSYPKRNPFRLDPTAAISDEELTFSHHNWNRPLGYGIQFDVVQLQRAGVGAYVDGKRFYANAQNKLYDWEMLKLHGSLNWFRFLSYRSFPSIHGIEEQPDWMKRAIINVESRWWMGNPPDFQGWAVDPILVTPILDKEALFNEPLYNRVFAPLWKRAGEALAACKRLVIIGYSFSSTDFRTKKLFLESFSTNNLQELIVVNPNKSAVETAEKLCHFKNAKVFPDLTSYMKHFIREEVRVRALESIDGLSSIFAEGRRVVEALDDAGFALPGAFWLLSTNRGPWTLFLVSPAVDLEGKQATLTRVMGILSSVKPSLKIEVGAVTVLSPNDGLANIMKGFLRTGQGISGARLSQSIINGLKIEDSYVYRMQ